MLGLSQQASLFSSYSSSTVFLSHSLFHCCIRIFLQRYPVGRGWNSKIVSQTLDRGWKKGCWLLWKRQPFTYEYIQRERQGRRRNKRHREWWGQPYRLQQTTLSLSLCGFFSLLFLQDIPRTHSNSRGFLLLHLSPRALKKTFSSDKTKKKWERERTNEKVVGLRYFNLNNNGLSSFSYPSRPLKTSSVDEEE